MSIQIAAELGNQHTVLEKIQQHTACRYITHHFGPNDVLETLTNDSRHTNQFKTHLISKKPLVVRFCKLHLYNIHNTNKK